jgi:hypothetical protein
VNDAEIFFVKQLDVVSLVDDASDDRLEVEQVVGNVGAILTLTLRKRNVEERL